MSPRGRTSAAASRRLRPPHGRQPRTRPGPEDRRATPLVEAGHGCPAGEAWRWPARCRCRGSSRRAGRAARSGARRRPSDEVVAGDQVQRSFTLSVADRGSGAGAGGPGHVVPGSPGPWRRDVDDDQAVGQSVGQAEQADLAPLRTRRRCDAPDSLLTSVEENPAWMVASFAMLAPLSCRAPAGPRPSGRAEPRGDALHRAEDVAQEALTVLTRLLVVGSVEPEQAPEVRQTDVERGDPALLELTGRWPRCERRSSQLVISSTDAIESWRRTLGSGACAVTSRGRRRSARSPKAGKVYGQRQLEGGRQEAAAPDGGPLGLGIGVEQVGRQPDRDALERSRRPQAPTATAGSRRRRWREPTRCLVAAESPAKGEFSRGMDKVERPSGASPLKRAFDSAAVAAGVKALTTNKQDNRSTALRFTGTGPLSA